MIPARTNRPFLWWFSRDAERRIRRHFSSVRVAGLERLRGALADGPVLVVSNHTSWWDALVVLLLGVRAVGARTYAMMDASNLRRLPFFALVGAFGVDRASASDGARSVRYAAKLLRERGQLVWIFAQGRETPATLRPLGFHGGSAAIARLAPRARVLPIALRYEHGENPDPVVWISIGAPTTGPHEPAVVAELDRIDSALAGARNATDRSDPNNLPSSEPFRLLFERGEPSWMRVAQALLAAVARPFALGRDSSAPDA